MPPFRLNTVFAPAGSAACCVAFGARRTEVIGHNGASTLDLALPVLGGGTEECLLERADSAVDRQGFRVFKNEGQVAGFATATPDGDLETATKDLYRRLFTLTANRRLYRIWNYVPKINAIQGNLENYRRFCRGRATAFEQHFGRGFQQHLPAASAVGTTGGALAVVFIAGDQSPQHFENPKQVPAFEYPPAYGPRPPSFSRATLVRALAQQRLFVSGTAAIRGHATVAAHDLATQLACTRENLNLIGRTAGAGEAFGAKEGWRRSMKVYVRHAADLPQIRSDLKQHLLREQDGVTYLHADLCRADLLVEIEAVLTRET
jgi:enamine deaminase RidA (YjgF/YER057c/UK114 family)